VGAVVQPGTLLLLGCTAGLGYFAFQEESSIRYGMFIVLVLLAGVCGVVFYFNVKEAAVRLVEVSILPNALRAVQLRFDREEETLIDAPDLKLNVKEHRSTHRMKSGGRDTGRVSVRYSLQILGKDGIEFTLRDSREVLAGFLEKVQQSALIPLKANESDFVRDFKSVKSLYRIGSTFRWGFVVFLICIGGISVWRLWNSEQVKDLWRQTFQLSSPAISGYWRVESEGMALGTLVLGQDSTLNENVFYQHGNWTYDVADSTGEPVSIGISNNEGARFDYRIEYRDHEMKTLLRQDGRKFTLTRSEDVDYTGNNFAKLTLAVLNAFIVPSTSESQHQYFAEFISGWMPDHRLASVLHQDESVLALYFKDEQSREGYAAVFSRSAQRLTQYLKVYGNDNCTHNVTGRSEQGERIIRHTKLCGGTSVSEGYTIDADGGVFKQLKE
jgi:hypothetical protein